MSLVASHKVASGGLCFFMDTELKLNTHVYVDGFNLYYGALKESNFKWLDLNALVCNLLTKNKVNKIKYFTARVSPRYPGDSAHKRQWTYFKALKSLSNLEIHEGHYLSHVCKMPTASLKRNGRPNFVSVIKTEEKGSDVNLASHLLLDAFKNQFECAVVISNDSDLFTPINMVRNEFKKKIGILNPHTNQSKKLQKVIDFYRPIREGALSISQFPPVVSHQGKNIMKPTDW